MPIEQNESDFVVYCDGEPIGRATNLSFTVDKKIRWGIKFYKTYQACVLGANLNINIKERHCYLCISLGFGTLLMGRCWFP